MASNKNVFYASDPSKLPDALWQLIERDENDFSDCIIFLPSRRAVRRIERFLVDRLGEAVLLPTLVALGEGAPEDEDSVDLDDVISNQERVIILARLLSADSTIGSLSSAFPIARDLVRMQDYLENEGIDSSDIDWIDLVDERYAKHFQHKAKFLEIVTKTLLDVTKNKTTQVQKRNADIRGWINNLDKWKKVIVCGSTASVPAARDLMIHISGMKNGYIILPGKISGDVDDFLLDTNPYNSEYKFLKRISVSPDDIKLLDLGGDCDIDFLNSSFGNSSIRGGICRAHRIDCVRESEEAECVAEIAARAVADNKTVLVITPDAAGNQRISAALHNRGIDADFSSGISGIMTLPGRALLNLFDDWIDERNQEFDRKYKENDFNLFNTITDLIEMHPELFLPEFSIDSDESLMVFQALEETSNILLSNKIILNLTDVRAVLADTLGGISVRPVLNENAKVFVLGTIESRMQTADVVILTGLNEGMFPSSGYENDWLPRNIARKIGLPPPERKVSLMALDFINLSCGRDVYWLRSRNSGSNQTTESRFLSRIDVMCGGTNQKSEILDAVRSRDNVKYNPLDYSAPRPPADRTDVYVTDIEILIHNPYAFYARHILRLYPIDDYWKEPDARDFGNLVHGVIEKAIGWSANKILSELDERAKKVLPADSVVFHFWHKRFVEIAPCISEMLADSKNSTAEIKGKVIVSGRKVLAKADRVGDGFVLDVKTGSAPSKKQLEEGNMPQLPLEAYILQQDGFPIKTSEKSKSPVMRFLQLKNNNVKMIEYDADITQKMMYAALDKVSQLFGRYSKDFEQYEYYETSDRKYKAYDDLARVDD